MVSPRMLPRYVERSFDPVYRPPFLTRKADLFIVAVAAEPGRLQSIIDTYLNEPTQGRVRYEATERFVILMFADLRQMGSNDPRDVRRGMVEEHELSIWLPMRHAATKLPAWYLPYVFNNEPSAVVTGREVYGYPKIYTPIPEFRVDEGDHFPAAIRIQLPYLDEQTGEFSAKELVTLERAAAEEQPAEGKVKGEFSSIRSYPSELANVIGQNADAAEPSGPRYRLRLSQGRSGEQRPRGGTAPIPTPARPDRQLLPFSKGGGIGNILRSLAQSGPKEKAYGLLQYAPLVFLKQFRDAEYPDRACYQAVVQARLVPDGKPLRNVDAVNRADRKFVLRMPNTPDFPIVDELGLEGHHDADAEVERRVVPVLSMIRVSTSFSIDLGRVIWHRGG